MPQKNFKVNFFEKNANIPPNYFFKKNIYFIADIIITEKKLNKFQRVMILQSMPQMFLKQIENFWVF
jgi:hypothetical protein